MKPRGEKDAPDASGADAPPDAGKAADAPADAPADGADAEKKQ